MIKKYIVATLLIITVSLLGGCKTTEDKDIGKDKAQEIAFTDANVTDSDISELHIARESEDGKTIYQVEFTDIISGASYDYEILASDGTIQKVDKENTVSPTSEVQQTQNPDNNQPEQTKQDEVQTGSQNQDSVQNNSQNQDNSQRQNKQQNNSQAQVSVSLAKAQKLALARVPGATENDIRIKLDYDDGYYLYEGEILYGQKEYEFEIDANTGTFLEWSEERR